MTKSHENGWPNPLPYEQHCNITYYYDDYMTTCLAHFGKRYHISKAAND